MTVVPRGRQALLILIVERLRTLQLIILLVPAISSTVVTCVWALQRLLTLPVAAVVLLDVLWLLPTFVNVFEMVAV